jgi:hypothetical protein
MTSPSPAERKTGWILPAVGVLWILMYFGARVLLKGSTAPTGVRIAIAMAPIPAFATFLWLVIRGVRSADEFERRIHLEALAVAYPLAMLLLMTLGLLQRAIELKFEDWSYAHVWYYLPLFYLLGLWIARRRYA